MGACDAQIILVSVVHNGTALGTPTAVSIEKIIDRIVIPGAGVIGPTCRGTVRGDLIELVDFLEKGAIAYTASAGSLVNSYKDTETDTQTDTLATMLAGGVSKEGNRDAPPFKYRQRFEHKGDMASDPLT